VRTLSSFVALDRFGKLTERAPPLASGGST